LRTAKADCHHLRTITFFPNSSASPRKQEMLGFRTFGISLEKFSNTHDRNRSEFLWLHFEETTTIDTTFSDDAFRGNSL
jgi:hypothetical protein